MKFVFIHNHSSPIPSCNCKDSWSKPTAMIYYADHQNNYDLSPETPNKSRKNKIKLMGVNSKFSSYSSPSLLGFSWPFCSSDRWLHRDRDFQVILSPPFLIPLAIGVEIRFFLEWFVCSIRVCWSYVLCISSILLSVLYFLSAFGGHFYGFSLFSEFIGVQKWVVFRWFVWLICSTDLIWFFCFSCELVFLIYFPANFCGLSLLLLIDVVQKWVVFCWFFARNCLWSLLWFFFVYSKVLVCLLRKWRKIESNENLKCQIFHYIS